MKIMNNLWRKSSYKTPVHFLIDSNIREFDISKANINVLRDAGVLSEEQYQYFLKANSNERYIAIGKMQGADTKVTEALQNGITNARKIFMELNCIDDSDILAIRNDAITIIGNKPVKYLNVTDRVRFREVARYTSFYHLGFLDLLYLYDSIENIEAMDIKGMSDKAIELHKPYMFEFLSELFYRAQMEGVKSAIQILSNLYANYVSRSLDIGFYREFNSESRYRLIPGFSTVVSYTLDHATNADKPYINIGWNENLLRDLNKMYSTVYFGSR